MVSIIPSARSNFDLIGDAIGQNLNQNLPGVMERAQNRQMGLNAIDQLQKDLEAAGGDINKIMPAVARAYSLNPNLERSGIAEQALMRAKASQGTGKVNDVINQIQGNKQGLPSFLEGTNGQPGQMGSTQSQGQPAQQPQPTSNKPTQGIFLSQLLPQDIGELISPEQTAKILEDTAKSGGDVAFTRKLINDYNQGKISFNDLANSNVEKEAANVQRKLGFEDQIRQRIERYLPKDAEGNDTTPESTKNIYYNMVKKVLKDPSVDSFSDAWQKVEADIDNFNKLNEAYIQNIPKATFQGISPKGEVRLRNSAKPIMDVDPLAYNTLEQAYTKKGHSPITPAKILKPLPRNVQGIINQAGDYKDLIYPSSGFDTSDIPLLSERRMQRNIDEAFESQDKDINKLGPMLRKNWNEDLSLLNIYADLRAKGWNVTKITTLLDDIQDKFSPRQQAERAMLNQEMRVPPRYLGLFGEGNE